MKEQQVKFILNYCDKQVCVSAVDEAFHEQFYQKFGGARKKTLWGRNQCTRQ